MITWNKELYHSWGKSPKQKAREKSYNHQYYLKNKEKWKNNTRSTSDNVFAGDWPARIRAEKQAIDAEYEALGRPLTEQEKRERDRRKKELDQEYQIGISSGAYQEIGLISRPRPRKKFTNQSMNRSMGSDTMNQIKEHDARKEMRKKGQQLKEELIDKPRAKAETSRKAVQQRQALSDREKVLRKARKWEEEHKKKKKKAKTSNQ